VEVWPGNAYPLGASFDGIGTNLALFSEAAEAPRPMWVPDDFRAPRLNDKRTKGSA
jgi:isoamylase